MIRRDFLSARLFGEWLRLNPSLGPSVAVFKHIDRHKDDEGDDQIDTDPLISQKIVPLAPKLIYGGGDGGGLSWYVTGDHRGSSVLPQCPCEGEDGPGQYALFTVRHDHTPEEKRVGKAKRLAGIEQCAVEGLERPSHGAVHEGERDDGGGENRRVPRHGHPDAVPVQNSGTDWPQRADRLQKEKTDDRGGKDHGKSENAVENAFDDLMGLRDVMGREDPQKKRHKSGDRGDAKRVVEWKPIHVFRSRRMHPMQKERPDIGDPSASNGVGPLFFRYGETDALKDLFGLVALEKCDEILSGLHILRFLENGGRIDN